MSGLMRASDLHAKVLDLFEAAREAVQELLETSGVPLTVWSPQSIVSDDPGGTGWYSEVVSVRRNVLLEPNAFRQRLQSDIAAVDDTWLDRARELGARLETDCHPRSSPLIPDSCRALLAKGWKVDRGDPVTRTTMQFALAPTGHYLMRLE